MIGCALLGGKKLHAIAKPASRKTMTACGAALMQPQDARPPPARADEVRPAAVVGKMHHPQAHGERALAKLDGRDLCCGPDVFQRRLLDPLEKRLARGVRADADCLRSRCPLRAFSAHPYLHLFV